MSKKTKAIKQNKSFNLLGKFCMAGFVLYLVFTLVMGQVDIVIKRQELATLDAQIAQQQEENMELERLITTDGGLDYIERVARDRLNYASPDERVFVDMSGK